MTTKAKGGDFRTTDLVQQPLHRGASRVCGEKKKITVDELSARAEVNSY
jgi:hypothetical protein